MEDIGDFVVFKQLVTSFCPQVLKYIYVYIYIYELLHMPLVFVIFHMGRFPTNIKEKRSKEK